MGGAVRDALLGIAHLDWDIATSARPEQVCKVFRRTVPVGIEFGTVGVLDEGGVMHEVTTFRRDVRTDGRHAEVAFGVSLDDDLARRDFTINAIAYDPESGELRDPFDGRTDLSRGIVRAVGDARERMREDRLRALRAIRFAARFRFHVEPSTWAAIAESAPFLTRLSAERVKQELEKTMEQVDQPSVAMRWWRETGALAVLVPALADAPDERFRALDYLPRTGVPDDRRARLDRLAMLFFGAEPATAERALRALRFSNADRAWIGAMVEARARLGAAMDDALAIAAPVPPATLRRWVSAIGRTRADAFCALTAALHLARAAHPNGATGRMEPPVALVERLAAFRAETVRAAFNDPIELADLAVDGEDLRAAGVPAGPEIGRTLRDLLDRVLDDPACNTRERLLRLVRR